MPKPSQVFLVIAMLTAPLAASPPPDEEIEKPELGVSAAPIISYDDKRGWILGAAGFVYSDREPGVNAGFFGMSNGDDFHIAAMTYDKRSPGPWSYALNLLAERGFDNYYGEGDQTIAQDHIYVTDTHLEARPGIFYRPQPHLRLGIFADYRYRHEDEPPVLPNESSSSYGLHIEWDSRNKLINPRQGDFLQLDLSQNTGVEAFSQAALDLRRFRRLSRSLTLASRFIAAGSLGQPSYLFRYRLGGLYLLRGYKDNRFRGAQFFVVQEELRWILKKWLSLNVSVDAGDVRDDAFHQLKATGQAGVRLGLPPGWGQKMRLDFGFSADQNTFQVQFGEIF